jgi:hypothetical protein
MCRKVHNVRHMEQELRKQLRFGAAYLVVSRARKRLGASEATMCLSG